MRFLNSAQASVRTSFLHLIALCAFACIMALALCGVAYADDMAVQEEEGEGARLVYTADNVVKVGKPDLANGSVAGFGFAFAYADTVLTNTVHTWKEYDTVGKTEADFFGKSMGATYDTVNWAKEDDPANLSALCKALSDGHVLVLHVQTSAGKDRWVAIVGYRGVTNAESLTLHNFDMYDPWGEEGEWPERLDCRDYKLFYEGDIDLFISKDTTQVVKGQDFYQYLYGMITLQKGVKAEWRRVFGVNAPGTMATIAGSSNLGHKTVVLAAIEGYWDALSASGLAGAYGSPILLTEKDTLSAQARYEMERLFAEEVIIVGGTASVSEAVENTLKNDMKLKVKRLAGDNAAETALRVYSDDMTRWNNTAVLATVNSYHDALSIAPFAFAKKAPIFLTIGDQGEINNESWQVLAGFDHIVIVGGTASVSSHVENGLSTPGYNTVIRLAGDNAYDTSLKIADWCIAEQEFKLNQVGIATGTGYWDALAAGAACGQAKSVLILAADENTTAVDKFVKPHAADINMGIVYGGNASVSDDVFEKLMKAA